MDTKNYFNDIKSVQDILRKDSLQEYYRDTILGFTILKRLIGLLSDTQPSVDKAFAAMKQSGVIDKDKLLSESGHGYYNVCKMTFDDLLSDPQKYYSNTKKMIEGFSDNVTFIFGEKGLDLVKTAKALDDKGALYGVLKKFQSLELGKMDNAEMGKLFGQLICMVYGTVENGQNWTPSDFVELLTKLLLAEGCDNLKTGFNYVSLLDNCVGSGQLTSHFEKTVTEMNPLNNVVVYGQDNSDLSIAICKAEQLMIGQKAENFVVADTLKEDPFPNDTFDYVLQNAPYGCGRKKADEDTIKNLLGEDLPASTDNQMLFWKAAIRKLKDKGRAALLSNGSPLFSGSTLSGESKIRKWLFDRDYVEAIIRLPDQGFIDTGITIYAWIINKNGKSEARKNWIQVIDASEYFHPLKKGIGYKRKEMSTAEGEDVDKIVELYKNFNPEKPTANVKYFKKEDFYYSEVTIQQPYQRNFKIEKQRFIKLREQSAFNSLYDEEEYLDLDNKEATLENLNRKKALEAGKILQNSILLTLEKNQSEVVYNDIKVFTKIIENLFPKLEKKYIKAIVNALSEKDKLSLTYKDKKTKSGLMADSDLNDSEFVPLKYFEDNQNKLSKQEVSDFSKLENNLDKSVLLYFQKEVRPYLPDSWFADGYDLKIGCEININKLFYSYKSYEPSLSLIDKIVDLETEESTLIKELFNGKHE